MATGLLSRYRRLLRLEPWPAILSRLGAATCVTILALRGAVSLIRWSLWKLINGLESLLPSLSIWNGARSFLEWVYFRERDALKWAVLLSIPVALLAAVAFLRKPERGRRPTALREPRALAGIDPVRERRNPGCHEILGAAIRSPWSAGIEWAAERRRVDLLVEECIPIEMKYALQGKGAGERDRARSQVECYAPRLLRSEWRRRKTSWPGAICCCRGWSPRQLS